MRKRRKARPLNLADFDRNSLISRADAVRLIAEEVARSRNTVSQRIRYAIKTQKLATEIPGRFVLGKLAAWAQDTWPGKFSAWPASRSHLVTPGCSTVRLPPIRATGSGRVVKADTVEGWREYATCVLADYEKLLETYHDLFFELDELRQEVERLRVYEFKAEQTREKNREAGRKGGRGRRWENWK